MTTMLTTLREWQDDFFDLVDRVEEPVVKFTGEVAESLTDYVPQVPSWPFLSQLPTVSDLVENQIWFATHFVEQQATFARNMVKALQPVLTPLEAKPRRARKARKPAAPAAKAA